MDRGPGFSCRRGCSHYLRVRETRTPVSTKKIVIPPLGMATGFSMFIVPAFRLPWAWAGMAFLIGAAGLAYPLLRTTRLVREGDVVTMQRSTAFFSVIILLAAIRLLARGYLDRVLSVEQTGALLFVLAFGMILRWRTRMLFDYRKLIRTDVP
ncbi:MAG TPA: cytochrome c biogenesis protein CcdC [Bryobacteraceae bacterium]|nr:cytochrome c biogenesis protein CcdC [Bryobacteraceae bacterium]